MKLSAWEFEDSKQVNHVGRLMRNLSDGWSSGSQPGNPTIAARRVREDGSTFRKNFHLVSETL
jgi:hypothetical protein